MRKGKHKIREIGKQLLAVLLCMVLVMGEFEVVVSAAEIEAEQETSVPEATEPEMTEADSNEEEESIATVPEEQEAEVETSETEISETGTLQNNDTTVEGTVLPVSEELEENFFAVDDNFPNVVYVGKQHGDGNIESAPWGQTPAYPYPTLEDAYQYVTDGGTIKVVDELALGSWPTNANKNVTIEGWTGEIAGVTYSKPTILMEGDWTLKGDTTIQKLTIKQNTSGTKTVYPEGHRIQIGSGEKESVKEDVKNGPVVPRVADTSFRDKNNGQSGWFQIGTGPADGIHGEHIEKVDVHIYGGGNGVKNFVSVIGRGNEGSDVNTVTTPNLETIEIEIIGSSKERLSLPPQFWVNGMAPAFDGNTLKTADITLGYADLSTHSLFRPTGDSKDKRGGDFSLKYTLDKVTLGGSSEAVAFGEAYTTGGMTIDVWDSTFTGSSQRGIFVPCVGAGSFGELNINLHNSSLQGLGNHHIIHSKRNEQLQYDVFNLTLDNSHITDHTAFQDNMNITLRGQSSIGNLNYYPKTESTATTACVIKNEGTAEIGSIDANPADIENVQGADLTLFQKTAGIRNIKNAGNISLKEAQTWQGNYTGGTETTPGKLTLLTGATLDIKGTVSGTTDALAEQAEIGSPIATILAEKGKKECITWKNTEGTKTELDGYWSINLGEDIVGQDGFVYVRYGGSDKNQGTSYNDAVKSLCKAYELATVAGTEHKKIVICDAYVFSDTCAHKAQHSQIDTPVVMTTTDGVTDFGEGYGAKLLASTYTDKNKPAGGVSLQHAFEFQHITITDSVQTPENKFLNIYANGHPTIMGEGTAFVPYTSVFGGSESDEVAGTSLRVLDGTYFHIYGGNYKGEIEGDINLRVEKADFRTPGYGEDDTMSIVGGNREGTVKGNISVTVIPEEGQEITNVLRIVGGNYTSGSVTGNLTTEISGDVSFQTGTSSPVNNAIVGGCFKLSPVTGNIKLTVHDIIGTGMPYIIGGNGWTSKVDGNIDVDVDNVRANRMIGGCGWTYSSTTAQNHWGSVTGDIVMNIGKKGYVEADSIYGCSGDMGSSAVSTGNKEYKPRSMTMNLGQVSAGIVSGGLMGITVSDDTRKVLNLNIQGESQIRELLEFADINVAESAVLIYNGMSLTGDRLNNNGTIRYQEGNVSVKSDYVAGTNAQLQLNSHTTVTHEKGISGRTKVSSVTGKSALTVRAKTEKITEQDKANSFVSTNSDMPLEYSTEEEMSVWKYNPSGEGIYDFVYVDGTKGNDEWSGTKPTKGENVEANQGGEEITLGPVKTLERAYELIKDGGYIIVCGKTAISRWPNVQKKAFITSDASLVPTSKDNTDYRKGNTDEQGEENTGLFFNPRGGNKYIVLEDDLTLRNLDFHYEYDGLYGGVDANGNTLIIGDESDTGLNITEIEPDVRFYKIQDGKRMTPDTFLLVGGGIFDKTPEKIHLEVYNTEVKAVIALWGGTVEEEKRVVSGNVTLKVQDCKTQKGLYYCSYDSAVDATDSIRYKGGYGEVQGDAEVEISLYNSQKAPHLTSLAQLCGLKLVKNLGNGKLHYINATDRQPRMYNECEMFHAAKKCSITYENIGTGSIDFDRFYPVDRNTGMDGGEDTQVEITLLGNITIPYAALNRGVQDNSENISVVLNLGDKIQGSKGINFTNTSGQFISSQYQTERNCYKSYRINYYPGADVKFDLGLGAPITTEQGDYPVVALQSLQSDLENGTQTEHILEAPDFVNKAVLECNNSKAVRTVDTEDRLYDLRLVKGGSYTYNQDDFQLNGKLSMEAGTKLITNGTVSIENDLKLKENVIFPVEYFLTVNGKIDSEKNASLLVNNAALITVGGAAGNTRVDFNGDTNNNPKGHFEIRAKKGENAEAYAEERFTGGTAIDLTYKDKEPYVTWTYGTLEPLDEIFLDGKNGEEGNSGNRPEEAVQTLQQALEHAVSSGNPETDEIQIVISGKYTFEKDKDGTLPNELLEKLKEKKIVITQNADSIDTTYNSKVSIENGFEIPCSLTFEKIRLSFSGDNPELYAGGNALTIGEGVIVQTDKKYPSIYGGHNSETVEGSTEVNIYSGTWFRIYGGGKSGTVNGNTQVTLGDDLTKAAPVIKTETEKDYSSETNAVFGGGQSGEVTGTAQVTVNYGKDYGYIFGGSESGTVNNTEVSVKDAQIYRIYGGSYDGTVSGNAKINFHSGSANRIYGGGSTNKTSVASTEVNIGKERKDASSATVKDYLRGSGEQGGVTGKAVLNIKDGALITKDCKAAAGGYTGGVARSILNISGGEVQTDIYAGGAGEFKMDNNGTLLDEIDPTKGVVSASEVHVTGGNVTGSVYGGGNMGSVGTAEKPTGDNVTVAEITGGIITGDFYGGGSLAPTHGNICMTLNMSNDANIGGGAFGGGKGRAPEGSKAGVAANVEGNITVTVQSAHVETGIYGGCNLNGSVENSQVNVSAPADCRIYGAGLGAETYVEKTNIDLNLQDPLLMTEKEEKNEYTVYGGGEQGKTGTSNVNIQNWVGNVYGGGRGVAEAAGFANSVKSVFQETANTEIAAFSGEKPFTILGLKDANTKETNVTISGKFMGNAYGGGELATVGEENNGTVGAGAGTPVTNVTIENGAQVTGNIYGGGKGEPNQDFAKIYGDTSVVVNGGIVQSDENVSDSCVFGGGEIAPVKGNTNVTVSSGHVQNVFGGNDRSGKISGNTNVTIEGGEADNVYGGGRNAAYNDTSSDVSTQVVIKGGTVGNAYGGGYGSSAICQNTSLTIKGGQTGTAFAGGNAATVANKAVLNVNVPKTDGNTPPDVTTIFAGNNQAAMNIQPTINLTSGKIGTFYGGGNQGDMTIENGLSYGEKTFGSADISIDTVYGGCNNADVTDGATLELSKGTYGEVYGGNNAGGEAHQSNVILNGEQLNVTTVYGGGNKASIEKTSITALNGEIGNIYGGGNEATAKESVHLQTKGNVTITNVYCGNNQAVMDILPTIDLQKGKIKNFYGGGNEGAMELKENQQLEYSFNSENMEITNVYGGGHKADVKGSVSLTFGGTRIETAYGGCNAKGQVDETNVIVRGSGTHTVYGGGQGEETEVKTANVKVQNGMVTGNIYGGSGFGKVQTTNVTVQEENTTDKIKIMGSVYGGGYGESSVVETSNVKVDMKLDIATKADKNADLIVTEADAETTSEEVHSGETRTEVQWENNNVSFIQGSVYGGGDMGKVGNGRINASANTADIDVKGSTNVLVKSGYIKGSVFGGGSGTPAKDIPYTAYMGTVFGNCNVLVNGGYVEGSIYGCGHQSRVYAPEDSNASIVNIEETQESDGIIIGTSVFGGGNKGEGNTQNASVYTVIGDTEVNIKGLADKKTSTGIYFLSDSKGGVYGDGNLCLVNGERVVNLTDFNYGSANKRLLKTFYSLQRADEVNLENSRVVLRGAKDLVDETVSDTEYAINRVGKLNMKKNSAVKLTTVVNLLGELTSDQNPDTTYIDRGNNGTNDYVTRGGEAPERKLTEEEVAEYHKAYLNFLGKGGEESKNYTSFNVVCVANGSYLEIKKSDTEYGNVKGLFTLELLHANPGEGGGFVYAEIGRKETPGSTGDFICTTPNEKDENADYMDVKDTVGGYTKYPDGNSNTADGDYTYYYWYIKGGKYTYNTNLKGYIGTTETEFETAVDLTELEENHHYILNSITGEELTSNLNSANQFCDTRFVDEWKPEYEIQDKYAIEVRIVPRGKPDTSGVDLQEESIGYLSYGENPDKPNEKCWGIKTDANTVITGTNNGSTTDVNLIKKNDVYKVQKGTSGLSLQFILHKGRDVKVEFKDVPVTLNFDVLKGNATGDGYEPGNGKDNAHLTVNTFTSITRIVPTQAAFIGSGRLYAGVSSDIPVRITKNSAFTAQFITKFVPSAFNTTSQNIQEVLTTGFDELYLLDEETGIGFTAVEDAAGKPELKYATQGEKKNYTLKKEDDKYLVSYTDEDNQLVTHDLEVTDIRREAMALPEGTVITLVAQIDDYAPTYWYYYCTEKNLSKISLSEFRRMGSTEETPENKYSFENASNKKISALSSNRVTENLTFVFDFSNVTEDTANNYPWIGDENVKGALMLRHLTTIGSFDKVDIMDYVSSSAVGEGENLKAEYTREHPAVSNTFDVSKDKTGLKKFEMQLTDNREHYTKDTYKLGITIEEDEDFINTQYEEREYAVVLQQTTTGEDGKETVIPFPEGTLFRYQGKNIVAGSQNSSVIIPVKKAGQHEVEMETTLEEFNAGDVHLKATLYSANVASYYKDGIEAKESNQVTFKVSEKQETALKVNATDEQQLFVGGDEIALNIQSRGNGVSSSGTVAIYKYERSSASYEKKALTEVFSEAENIFEASSQEVEWKAKIKPEALSGTYRLEFIYEDKTEYWDFIIQ